MLYLELATKIDAESIVPLGPIGDAGSVCPVNAVPYSEEDLHSIFSGNCLLIFLYISSAC